MLAFCAASAWLLRGWPGALLAVLAASLPSAVLAVWILLAWNATAANPWVARAVVAVSLVLSYGFGLSPILILALAALAGYFWLEP